MDSVREIYQKALNGTATESEMYFLRSWMAEAEHAEEARALLVRSFSEVESTVDMSAGKAQAILEAILAAEKQSSGGKLRKLLPRYWKAAAVIALLALGGLYYNWLQQKQPIQPIARAVPVTDIDPAHQGAILTLSDGSEIVLDSAKKGILAAQNGVNVVLDSGQLSYNPTANTENAISYNMVNTPKGRQFSLQLPDGSKVWLNAASSIKYPTSFNGNQRLVVLSGEAYFEVAKNSKMPFRVNINNKVTVDVLGTSFNINAYGDNGSINTTLITGAVAIQRASKLQSSANKRFVLKPGQAAQVPLLQSSSGININYNADIRKALAWKNGAFNLEGASLKDVMKEVERWYNIEVVYEDGNVPDIYFTGEMSRNVKLSSFLKALKEWQINYRLEGNRLTILP
ncbi:iron dicitrate transport regulator FecR [Chitinophaga caeni]|uniref:Iron dicitrate transport regulator FecR n=1 Tax=Chitinophaga caeni TaxID=2029983 RepID=A0A291QYT7_9BACT|nr:FecR family protein [Chitinophaga caeni]ATL49071.1 iron dicitrate transport regulator FecR [Chitinophaga caeni]